MRFYILLTLMGLFDVGAVIAARFYVEKKKRLIMWISLLTFSIGKPSTSSQA